ncbi:MAG TPA: helix-turn-helix transcriptional regulator [Verrucomicrobiae bacterium]|nr:helix-turn-helix transcriptional regulator [Verrucomicrobiae bacterium]
MTKDQAREAVILQVIQALRAERERQHLSMNSVAERAGLSQSMLSLVERDLRNPTIDTLLRIADVLQVDLGKIITQARKVAGKQK